MHLNILSVKRQPFCLRGDELKLGQQRFNGYVVYWQKKTWLKIYCQAQGHFQISEKFLYILMWISLHLWYTWVKMSCYKIQLIKTLQAPYFPPNSVGRGWKLFIFYVLATNNCMTLNIQAKVTCFQISLPCLGTCVHQISWLCIELFMSYGIDNEGLCTGRQTDKPWVPL